MGLYERSLLVVLADHGVSFLPNTARRAVGEDNYYDLMPVPLFIKLPFQDDGEVHDSNVETVDVLPTLIDLLSVDTGWEMDGASVFSSDLRARSEKRILVMRTQKKFAFPAQPMMLRRSVEKKQEHQLFGSALQEKQLYDIAETPGLVGSSVRDHDSRSHELGSVELLEGNQLENVDLDSATLPLRVTGLIHRAPFQTLAGGLALAVDGVIQATAVPYLVNKGDIKFSAVLPETALSNGANSLSVHVIGSSVSRVELARLQTQSRGVYALERSPDTHEDVLIDHRGEGILVGGDELRGMVDTLMTVEDQLLIKGWVYNAETLEAAERILVFSGEELLAAGRPASESAHLARKFDTKALGHAGFVMTVALPELSSLTSEPIRVFAIGQGSAAELRYACRIKTSGIHSGADISLDRWPLGEGTEKDRVKLVGGNAGSNGLRIVGGGLDIPIGASEVEGELEQVRFVSGCALFRGWAVDTEGLTSAQEIMVFAKGERVYSGRPNDSSREIAQRFGQDRLARAGFWFGLPAEPFLDLPRNAIRVVAVAENGPGAELGSD
jgi:hypothetical protein